MSAMEEFYAQLQEPAADERHTVLARLAQTDLDDLALKTSALEWVDWSGETPTL